MTLQAFADGYAEAGTFPVPLWVKRIAHQLDGLTESLVTEAGRLEGRRASLHAARQRLYDEHREAVLAVASQLTTAADVPSLARDLAIVAGQHDAHPERRSAVKAGALDALLRALRMTDGLTQTWHQANADAYIAATARGQGEAAAAPHDGGPADPGTATRAAAAAAVGIASTASWSAGADWTDQQLSGLAGDVANQIGVTTDAAEIEAAIRRSFTAVQGVAYYLEEAMHAGYALGFAVMAQAASVTVDFVTVGDSKVESLCLSYAGANPWPPDSVPQPPVHGACRCALEYADPGVPVNGVLVGV